MSFVRLAVALLVALAILTPEAGAAGPTCRTSFAGCRTRAQKIRFCRSACVTTRTVCQEAFVKGRLERRCGKRALRACLGEGGSCIRTCDDSNPCPGDQQCVSGRCIMAQPCTTACGGGCCGGDYPNCGVDLRCWTKPCATVCGDTCCGGRYPNCGPDGRCWTRPCETVCGDTCCGGDVPLCDGGTCRPGTPGGGDGFPTNLPPGTYALTICITGSVSIPCQSVGSIPFEGVGQLKAAITTALDQWLAATAGSDCSRGATTYSGYNGSEFTATATATCGDATETVTITLRHL